MYAKIDVETINNKVYKELKNMATTGHLPDWYKANKMSTHKTIRNNEPNFIFFNYILNFLTSIKFIFFFCF